MLDEEKVNVRGTRETHEPPERINKAVRIFLALIITLLITGSLVGLIAYVVSLFRR
ncbi:MAG: hypothetical protein ACXVCY_12390 [Pseudobdellovibrionaceae bacterium]